MRCVFFSIIVSINFFNHLCYSTVAFLWVPFIPYLQKRQIESWVHMTQVASSLVFLPLTTFWQGTNYQTLPGRYQTHPTKPAISSIAFYPSLWQSLSDLYSPSIIFPSSNTSTSQADMSDMFHALLDARAMMQAMCFVLSFRHWNKKKAYSCIEFLIFVFFYINFVHRTKKLRDTKLELRLLLGFIELLELSNY